MNTIRAITLSLAALCAPAAMAALDSQAAKAIDQAVAAQKKAGSVGGEWRDVEPLIQLARKQGEAGKTQIAIKLANEAKAQAELGVQQAESQKTIPVPPYLR